MRLIVWLCLLLVSVQFSFAQEAPPVITIENVHRLRPLITIDPEQYEVAPFYTVVFSKFTPAAPSLFLASEADFEESYETNFNVWDLNTQQITDTFTFPSNGPVFELWQLPERSLLLVLGVGGGIGIRQYPSGAVLHDFSSTSLYYMTATISDDGGTLAYTNCDFLGAYYGGCEPTSWSLDIYDLHTLELQQQIDVPDFEVQDLVLSPTGQYLLVQSTLSDLIVWDTQTGEQVAFADGNCEMIPSSRNTLFVSDSAVLFSEETCPGHQVRLWDFMTGEERILFPNGSAEIRHVALSPDAALLGVLAHNEANVVQIFLLDFATGQILTQFATDTYRFDFSPDGRYLVVNERPIVIYAVE